MKTHRAFYAIGAWAKQYDQLMKEKANDHTNP